MNLSERDKQVIWHPFTQIKTAPLPVAIVKGEGAYFYDDKGKRYIDGIASWWVNVHGHCHPYLAKKISEQLQTLEHAIFSGFTHEPAVQLAERLLKRLPPNQSKIFYSDNGSTAVEVALKMAFQYWSNKDLPKTKVVAFENGYHGDTFGGMSVGARNAFNNPFAKLLFDVIHIPVPVKGREEEAITAIKKALKNEDVALFIFEPLIQGAGGMVMYSGKILDELIALCKEKNVITIADEVMTGFGRTGTLFASEQAHISPDILCVAKGITGGSIPLAATLCSEAIYAAHLSEDRARTFFHSSSYTGNAIACAAAVANLEIWRTEPVRERIAALAAAQEQCLEGLEGDPHFANGRQIGTITAVELTGRAGGYLDNVALSLRSKLLARGVLLRPLGNTVYVMPPYCATADELKSVYEKLTEAVDEVSA